MYCVHKNKLIQSISETLNIILLVNKNITVAVHSGIVSSLKDMVVVDDTTLKGKSFYR